MNFKNLFVVCSLGLLASCSHLPLFDPSAQAETEGQIVVVDSQIDNIEPVTVIAMPSPEYEQLIVLEEYPSDVAEADDLWWIIRQNLSLEVPDYPRVRSQRNWYASHPRYISRVSERASPYLHYVVEEIKSRNMPMELALLPIVESAFDPFAYSHGRASGMWQFIPGTGKRFGLNQNWWYDGRRDVYYSTKAALDYLEYLHKRFDGDWLHAVAAYNSGEGNVIRAIRKNKKKNKPTDFWSLDLPKETEAYVPKLLALADLLNRAEEFELSWYPIKNQPYFVKVTVDSQIDLSVAAELAEISMDDFYALNPAFNHWATEPNTSTDLLLPVDHKAIFIENLSKTPVENRVAFKRYIVKPGDSLLKLSKQFSTTPELLRSANGMSGNTIVVGKALLIPTASVQADEYSKSSANRLAAKQNRQRNGHKIEVKVEEGDSFWSLAREHKVGMRELAGWNNMAPTDPLKIGQKLVIWTPVASVAQNGIKNKTRKINYQVRSGDSIARIAGKFRVKVADVVRWNQINPDKYLQPGQKLTLYVDITRQF